MAEKNYRSGLRNKIKDYNWSLKDNKCSSNTIDDVCEEDQPALSNDCYIRIKELDRETNFYSNINKCVEDLTEKLKCQNEGDYLRCPVSFSTSKIESACKTNENAMSNIIDYCINHTNQPSKDEQHKEQVCNDVYDTAQMKKTDGRTEIRNMKSTSKYLCPDNCNLNKLSFPNVKKYTYSGTLKSDTNIMNCHEMSKFNFNCENIKDKERGDFDNYYHSFIKEGKFDWNKNIVDNETKKPLDSDTLDRLLKYSMCKIASDNIDIVKGAKLDESLTKWWNYNIFNKEIYTDTDDKIHKSGFQRNIFYISFFIVLFLKLTILSKFNIIPGTKTYLNKVLPILTIIFSIIIFYGFVNNLDWISTIARVSFYLFISAIIFGISFYIKDKIWSKDESNKQILAILLFVGCILLLVKSSWGIWGISDNSTFISVSILLYFIFISTFFILKSEKTTIVFKMISILIICLLLVVYLFYTKDLLFNIIYFYIFVFIILIFIICTNNTDLFSKRFNDETSSKYVKIINVILRPFKSENKMSSTDKISKFIILGLYAIFAFADSFISVLSPQMALVIMIAFRLILNRWFEPVNAVFASLSGYSMSNVEGTYDRLTTTNRGILDIDNLLSFFIK